MRALRTDLSAHNCPRVSEIRPGYGNELVLHSVIPKNRFQNSVCHSSGHTIETLSDEGHQFSTPGANRELDDAIDIVFSIEILWREPLIGMLMAIEDH